MVLNLSSKRPIFIEKIKCANFATHVYSDPTYHIFETQKLISCGKPEIFSTYYAELRWSQGNKAQSQGHKKKSKVKASPSEDRPAQAKDRNARGRGQGPRAQSILQKKSLQNFFRAISKKKVFKNFFQPISKRGIH